MPKATDSGGIMAFASHHEKNEASNFCRVLLCKAINRCRKLEKPLPVRYID